MTRTTTIMPRIRTFVLATLMVATAVTGTASVGHAGAGAPTDVSAKALTLAVIGDVPYGADQEASFGGLVDAVNADPKVRDVIHVGDIKSGSTICSDQRFSAVATEFARFQDPLVYTPGDNEWTDCHRVNNGGYDPLERLSTLREMFFSDPGSTLGRRPKSVVSESALPENVRWVESRVAFATLHVIGSDNGMAPWTGLGQTAPTVEQTAEVAARVSATLEWVDETFDAAEATDLTGVVLAMQADTWNPTPTPAQQSVIDRIVARTSDFPGEVLLLQGDSHDFTVDHPVPLPNLTRIVVHGETLPFEYLRLTVDPVHDPLFTFDRVALDQ